MLAAQDSEGRRTHLQLLHDHRGVQWRGHVIACCVHLEVRHPPPLYRAPVKGGASGQALPAGMRCALVHARAHPVLLRTRRRSRSYLRAVGCARRAAVCGRRWGGLIVCGERATVRLIVVAIVTLIVWGSFGFAKVRRRRRCLLPRELARAARCRPRRVARSERYGRRRGCVRRQAQRGGRPSLRRRLLARQCGGRVPRGGRGTTSMASTQHRACVAAAQDAIWKGTAMARETSQGAWHAHRDAHRSIQCQVNGAEGCGHGCCRLHRGCRAKRLLCPT